MSTPKTYTTKDVAEAVVAAGHPCSERTARRLVPDLREAKGEKQRTYNELEFKHAVQIVRERMRKPSARRLKREARASEAQKPQSAGDRGRRKR